MPSGEDASKPSEAKLPPWLRARRALGRVRRRFVLDTFDVFARPTPSPEEDVPEFENPPGYEFTWATPEDIEGCDAYHTELDERERLEGVIRLGFGHRAVIAKHDGVVVFSMWENPRNLNVPGLIKRKLSPTQSFIYKAFTSPDHRGRKLYETGMRFVLAALAAEGKGELVGYAHRKKRISRRGLAALRFRSVGKLRYVEVPLWRRTFLSRELVTSFPEMVPRTNVMAERLASAPHP